MASPGVLAYGASQDEAVPEREHDVGIFAIDTIEPVGAICRAVSLGSWKPWAEIHQRELLDDGERLQAGRPPFKIEPLRYGVVS